MSLTFAPQPARRAAGPVAAGPRTTPYLLFDVSHAVARYQRLQAAFGVRGVHYAVKANPHPELLRALVRAGGRFDVASAGEVELCLSVGAAAADLIFSNPVKRRADIAYAYAAGVRRFVADSTDELDKLAETAPGASVLVRLASSGAGSDHPLSIKFGRAEPELLGLLQYADAAGLDAAGVAFHVGSQQRDPRRWLAPIVAASRVFAAARAAGLHLRILDIGGGLPARHAGTCPPLGRYVRTITRAVRRHFGDQPPELLVEPGRGVVGDAGRLVTEVIGVTTRHGQRWVTLDVGLFSGLVEAMGEEIRYRLSTDRDDDPSGPVVLVGPTCDSMDVLYVRDPVMLPLTLAEGDRVVLESAGAYTTAFSTVGFNGFPALPTVLR